ncbi:unnamed protein product, partial [Protopolystoma xenopodis]
RSISPSILSTHCIASFAPGTADVCSTDSFIQKTLATYLADCTVLTITHRLHTVIQSDLIIVMAGGRIVESGPPYELLGLHQVVERPLMRMRSSRLVMERDIDGRLHAEDEGHLYHAGFTGQGSVYDSQRGSNRYSRVETLATLMRQMSSREALGLTEMAKRAYLSGSRRTEADK